MALDNISPELAAAIAAELARAQAGITEPDTTPQSQPIRINYNGQAQEFGDSAALQKFIDDQRVAMEQAAREAVEQARRDAAAAQPRPADPPKPPSQPDENGLTPETREFLEAFLKDPRQAIMGAVETSVEKQYGVRDPWRTLGATALATVNLGQQVATENFKATHRDFDPTNTQHLDVLNKTMQALGLQNVTPATLDVAWNYAKGTGHVPVDNPQSQPSNVRQMPMSPSAPFAAPPHPGRPSAGSPTESLQDIMGNAESLTKEQLNAVLSRLQAHGS